MRRIKGRLESRWVEAGGYRLHYRTATNPTLGERPTVILVHGLGVSSRHMVPAALHLSPFFEVLAPDLPGYGRSPKPWHVLDVAELSASLEDFMGALGVSEAVLVSLSFGCQIVIDLAARSPEKVIGSVLIGPTIDIEARSAPIQVLKLIADAPREPLTLFPTVLRDYAEFGLRRGFVTLMHALSDDVSGKLSSVTTPTLIVKGEHDPLVPDSWIDHILSELPRGDLAVIEGAAHAANFSRPAELADLVRDFVDDIETEQAL